MVSHGTDSRLKQHECILATELTVMRTDLLSQAFLELRNTQWRDWSFHSLRKVVGSVLQNDRTFHLWLFFFSFLFGGLFGWGNILHLHGILFYKFTWAFLVQFYVTFWPLEMYRLEAWCIELHMHKTDIEMCIDVSPCTLGDKKLHKYVHAMQTL